MAFIGDSLDVFVCCKDERLNFAVRHQHHKSAGADFAVAIIIQIDSADALARDDGTNGVVVIDFVVKVDLTVEVLTIFGEDDASAIFLGMMRAIMSLFSSSPLVPIGKTCS